MKTLPTYANGICQLNTCVHHSSPGAWMRSLAATLALFGNFATQAAAEPKPDPQRLGVREINVDAAPIVAFDHSETGKRKFGELTFIGGLTLSSRQENFGGWSGIAIERDGHGLIAVSDAGLWMTARLAYKDGRPVGFEAARLGPLKALNGKPLRRERDRDAEAVELISGSINKGRLLIGFEQNHRIGHFDLEPGGVSAPHSYIRPDRSRGTMSALKGFEAVTVLRKGRYRGAILAIAERKHDNNGDHTGWLWTGRKAHSFSLADIGGYDITGAAVLPDGDLILLERRFNWLEGVKMRLRRIHIGDLRPGARIEGEVLLAATMGQNIDNMEGIAIHQDPGGAAIITLISDDNFNRSFQRTLLLQFRLDNDRLDQRAEER